MLITRAALPHMKANEWGRIINNTTSYRTMLRVLPYGATKSALEAMTAVWAVELNETGITVNVLVPGGATDTALIADASGWPRAELLRPEIMGPAACWLISDEANGFTGKRVTALDWSVTLPPGEAAKAASRPIGWPELAKPPKDWQK
jgi:NAD(P)-dependent dehydrogenase (short-subunit alcohol dehydrogenase family)